MVTWATVCSPRGISSFRNATRETTELGSASIIILEQKIQIKNVYYNVALEINFVHFNVFSLKHVMTGRQNTT